VAWWTAVAADQPYLTLALLLAAVGLAWGALFPPRPGPALWAAATAAPFGLFDYVYFVPAYWTPVQGRWSGVGVADLVFTAAAGGLAWVLATAPRRGALRATWAPGRVARRLVGGLLLGLALAGAVARTGLPMHQASLVAMALGWGVLAWRGRGPRWLGLMGGPAFAAVYAAAWRAADALAPGFATQWNPAALSGLAVLGVPLEEVVWALAFGAAWPACVAYVLDVRVVAAVPAAATGGGA
jgi:hypothetical protein